jgi:hypothetical protein
MKIIREEFLPDLKLQGLLYSTFSSGIFKPKTKEDAPSLSPFSLTPPQRTT